MQITVETTIAAPLATVWHAWTTPEHIVQWNAASDDWHTTHAELELRTGGTFRSRMEARDGSMGFDFSGHYTLVEAQRRIDSALADGRTLSVQFTQGPDGVTVRETFDAESSFPVEHQRQGWQAILDRFARHVASL